VKNRSANILFELIQRTKDAVRELDNQVGSRFKKLLVESPAISCHRPTRQPAAAAAAAGPDDDDDEEDDDSSVSAISGLKRKVRLSLGWPTILLGNMHFGGEWGLTFNPTQYRSFQGQPFQAEFTTTTW